MPAGGFRAVALAAAPLAPPPRDARGVRAPRPSFIAVLTSGWRLVFLNHRLSPVWEVALRGVEGLPPAATPRDAALLVTHHPLADGDTQGAVIVVSSVRPEGASAVSDGGGGGAEDAVSAEIRGDADAAAAVHGAATTPRSTPPRRPTAADVPYADSHELTYVALDGRTGAVRWTRGGNVTGKGGDASSSSPPTDAATTPQHDFRLTAAAAAVARDAGARHDCADFRESVLDVLPHVGPSADGDGPPTRAHTRLRLAHFRHDGKASTGRRVRAVGTAQRAHPALAAARGGRAAGRSNAVARAAARAAAAAARGGARGSASAASAAALVTDHHATAADAARAWAHAHAANAIVAHTEAGIDVLHLYSGARVCSVRLPSPGVTVDLDGDGVLDYVVAVGGASAHDGGAATQHAHARACTGVALAGVPPRHPLWNVSLCGHGHGKLDSDDAGDTGDDQWAFSHGHHDDSAVAAAPPALLRTRDAAGRRTRAHSLIAFLTSHGDVVAVRQDGARAWRARARAPRGTRTPTPTHPTATRRTRPP